MRDRKKNTISRRYKYVNKYIIVSMHGAGAFEIGRPSLVLHFWDAHYIVHTQQNSLSSFLTLVTTTTTAPLKNQRAVQ